MILSSRKDGSLRQPVQARCTWNRQYIHFHTCLPLIVKNNFMGCLINRANRICVKDRSINGEEGVHRKWFLKSIIRQSNAYRREIPGFIVQRKQIHISLPFSGLMHVEITKKTKLSMGYNNQSSIEFSSNPARLISGLKYEVLDPANSFWVYLFTCHCGTMQTVLTTKCIRKCCPACLSSETTESFDGTHFEEQARSHWFKIMLWWKENRSVFAQEVYSLVTSS